MAEYSNLSATINAQIRANGVQAITGPVLNAVLTAMVNVLGDGYRLNGVAVPADNPGSPDNRVAYLAVQDGTYTNFGGLTISGEVALLLWDSAWTKETLFSIDTAVTPGSGHLVTSGAVDDALTTLANNIAAAYMQLVPAATEGNLAEFDNAGQVRDAGIATTDLATKDGHYPDLFAGFAGNLVDTRSAGTRQGPFAFRQSGGDGVNYMRKILGRTEAFNQLVQNGNFADSTGWSGVRGTISMSNNECAYSITELGTGNTSNRIERTMNLIGGHSYLVSFFIKVTHDCVASVEWGTNQLVTQNIVAGGYVHFSQIANVANDSDHLYIGINQASQAGFSVDDIIYFKSVQLIDLTLEGLGLTTADQFRALHSLPYYNYNAAVLKNNAATGLETTGFNQWDEECRDGYYNPSTGEYMETPTQICSKNPISVFPNTDYYILNGANVRVLEYDINGNFIGTQSSVTSYTTSASAAFIKINLLSQYGTTYNHDICINRSDASRNGEYEPYWKRDIVLGLDNLACHDEDNNAVVVNGLDGVGTAQDELIVENGWGTKIIKKMEEVDLGTLNWTKFINSHGFYATIPAHTSPKAICSKYLYVGAQDNWQGIDDKECFFTLAGNSFNICDYSHDNTSAADFKTAVTGVKLRYELATPKVLTLDNPIPALIEVDNLGTEKRLPEDTADNPQAPFECDSNYSVSTANLVRLLNL